MATLTVQEISRSGVEPSYVAADAGGDVFAAGSNVFGHVKNGGGGAVVLTIDSQVDCDQGFDHDETVNIPAGEERMIGPFPQRFLDENNNVSFSYDGVTSVTIGAFSL